MIKPVICLAGPTAAGKSAATLALAQRWPIEVIVMDSATIYRGMDIGTAKPSKLEQASMPHHLLDIRDPAESYSAAEFQRDASLLIEQIQARGNLPLLCGGTMLYYKALREGLNNLPQADPAVRAAIDNEARTSGWPELHRQLSEYDPVTAARLAPNDSQRLQRAIEIYRVSGRPMSDWLADARPAQNDSHRFVTLSLEPSDRLALHARIAARYHTMIKEGLLDEVRTLHARPDLHDGLPSVRCVGYRQLWEYLDGRISIGQAVEQAVAATRQLAKRQLTWLRSQPERQVIDCLASDAAAQVVDQAARQWN
ncbi:tRNA (adenosine(37)-N6)-dimethylallyltransferase MiaA [Pollutimonas harenae]|uniref:tRNA dimethylallyltransferase n=1 Tax=Pollutimonas harenae TaxID=657015 RepID=A0A853H385_9BURK|nr:tRNA (adenosine(37)-N6)-dimethylallyltransferase MiaA [Pollutimonas harenae]NYT86309.1 tRNA (adenosine(37)-N6)-dimethylallyltransferase MiaA [Pollutimonas harenae]TEA69933.1 tRNA (adenosine(37)-N6)-dimethylallyltransferase MiaA [Pollutimonas harenae]